MLPKISKSHIANSGEAFHLLHGWMGVMVAVMSMVLVSAMPSSVQAQTLDVIYSFHGRTDGSYPGSLVLHGESLYGTTQYGGTHNGCGTVFKVDGNGHETILYNFGASPSDGCVPNASIVFDASGNLYGTTLSGGNLACLGTIPGCGTVFKLDSHLRETVLHRFTPSGPDGFAPVFLTSDSKGNLYGAASGGGIYQYGVIFRMTTSGEESVLYSFTGGDDGGLPTAGLALDSQDTIYGTTTGGGKLLWGTVFKLTGHTETVLHNFAGFPSDGAEPSGVIGPDRSGDLFGTTQNGGAQNAGIFFKIDSEGHETVLYHFGASAEAAFYPNGGLLQDSSGNIYGTTIEGGIGGGTIFKLTPTLEFTFYDLDPSVVQYPFAGVTMNAAGNLYGTTIQGGSGNTGTVFKFTP